MSVTQMSDWSLNLQQSSIGSRNTQPRDNAWEEDGNENRCRQTNRSKIYKSSSLWYGFLIGSLLAGIVFATLLTLWLRSSRSAVTTTTNSISPLSTTTSQSTTSVTTTTTETSSTTTTTYTTESTTTTSVTTSTVTSTTTTLIPPNLLINPGAESGSLTPWVSGGSGVPIIDDGSANSGYNPYSGTKQFYGGSISSGSNSTLTQSVLLLNGTQGYTAAQLDSGYLSANISFYEQSYSQFFGTDEGQISLAFLTSSNTLISTTTTPTFACTNWCAQSYSYPLPMGTRRIDYTMIFILQTGYAIDSYFDDNSLKVY